MVVANEPFDKPGGGFLQMLAAGVARIFENPRIDAC
jgi:hypothetical protein